MAHTMRLLFGVCLFLAASSITYGADRIAPVLDDDPDMNAAIARAKQTLDDFLRIKSSVTGGTGGFTVKVFFAAGAGGEHMWVAPFRAASDGFEGILKSQPRFNTGLHYGQQVRFSRDQITDWGYKKDEKLIGYRTVCVFFARDPAKRAQAERDGPAYECAP